MNKISEKQVNVEIFLGINFLEKKPKTKREQR